MPCHKKLFATLLETYFVKIRPKIISNFFPEGFQDSGHRPDAVDCSELRRQRPVFSRQQNKFGVGHIQSGPAEKVLEKDDHHQSLEREGGRNSRRCREPKSSRNERKSGILQTSAGKSQRCVESAKERRHRQRQRREQRQKRGRHSDRRQRDFF